MHYYPGYIEEIGGDRFAGEIVGWPLFMVGWGLGVGGCRRGVVCKGVGWIELADAAHNALLLSVLLAPHKFT